MLPNEERTEVDDANADEGSGLMGSSGEHLGDDLSRDLGSIQSLGSS